ncbi:DUF4231 domain-containing protein [Kitasatospora sp. McL0602]|uniref:DUF4231 domain-containing protein n=1 Tax=Kitasatospora sp. McL0602 TaxID=3439530 RepID=UPI003F8CBA96
MKRDYWWAQLRGPADTELPPTVVQRLAWYDEKARRQYYYHLASEVLILLCGAAVPVSAAAGASTTVAGALGAAVVVGTGLRQLFRWNDNWIRLRRYLVSLQGEVASWSTGAAPYEDPAEAARILVARTEELVRSESGDWVGMLQDRAA